VQPTVEANLFLGIPAERPDVTTEKFLNAVVKQTRQVIWLEWQNYEIVRPKKLE